VRIIEGSVEEIVKYQREMGVEPQVSVDDEPVEGGKVAVATQGSEGDEDAWYYVEQHVYSRARSAGTKRLVLRYLEEVRELGTIAEIGESERTHDGLTNYIMVRDEGPRRFGAVAYVRPANGGLTLRLRADEVDDVLGEVVRLRQVKKGHEYAVICPLASEEAVSMAIELTKRALEKVR
jgi:hypothetical protein